jgi:hypothetical protein
LVVREFVGRDEMAIKNGQSKLELMLWNAEAEAIDSGDLYIWLRESGLPSEAAIRLKGLIDITIDLADHAINIGKIVLLKIIEFLKANPNLAIGVALGVAVGLLVGTIPLLGPLLAPIATALGVTAGAIVGHQLDKRSQGTGQSASLNPADITASVIEIAQAFFKLLIDTINAVFEGQSLRMVNNG